MQKTVKTLGNIDVNHPYYQKMLVFFDALLNELPFCHHLKDAVDNVLKNNIIQPDEYTIMFPRGGSDIVACLVDYLNIKAIDYCNHNADIKGVKAILKTLIMFQIRLKPNMPNNFKKVFNNTLLKTIPVTNITYFYGLIDTLWHCAGDTATDYNYYSKRFLLGNIYLETIFYACSDTSDDYADTEDYLIRSFDKIKFIEELKAKLPNITKIQDTIASFLGKIRYHS